MVSVRACVQARVHAAMERIGVAHFGFGPIVGTMEEKGDARGFGHAEVRLPVERRRFFDVIVVPCSAKHAHVRTHPYQRGVQTQRKVLLAAPLDRLLDFLGGSET